MQKMPHVVTTYYSDNRGHTSNNDNDKGKGYTVINVKRIIPVSTTVV